MPKLRFCCGRNLFDVGEGCQPPSPEKHTNPALAEPNQAGGSSMSLSYADAPQGNTRHPALAASSDFNLCRSECLPISDPDRSGGSWRAILALLCDRYGLHACVWARVWLARCNPDF